MNWLTKVAILRFVTDAPKDILGALQEHIDNYLWKRTQVGRLDRVGEHLWQMQFAAYKDEISKANDKYRFWIYVDMWWKKPLEETDKYKTEIGNSLLEFIVRCMRVEGQDIITLGERQVCDTSTEVAAIVKNFINKEDKDNGGNVEDFSPEPDPAEFVPDFDSSFDPSFEPSLVPVGR